MPAGSAVGGDAELLAQHVAMRLRGSRRDAELAAELLVRQPLGDQLDHLRCRSVIDDGSRSACMPATLTPRTSRGTFPVGVYFAATTALRRVFRSTPTPSSSSSTTSPGSSHGPPLDADAAHEQLARAAASCSALRARRAPATCRRARRARAARAPHRSPARRRDPRTSSSGVTSTGPIDRAKSLLFDGPKPDCALGALEVARRPVVRERDAADRAVRTDHRGDAEAEVELARPGRVRHRRRPGRRSAPCCGTRRTAGRGARTPRRRARSAGAAPAGGTRRPRAGTRRARARRRRR